VSETVSGATTYYLVDNNDPTGYSQVVEELQSSGGTLNAVREYVTV
jgi:hypothetical protein